MSPSNKNKKNHNNNKNKENSLKRKRKTIPATRFNVDDPVNDIHDDELFGDEVTIPKENIDESDNFEKPW